MGCRGEERHAPNARYDVSGRGCVAGLCNVTVGLSVLFDDLIIGEISDWRIATVWVVIPEIYRGASVGLLCQAATGLSTRNAIPPFNPIDLRSPTARQTSEGLGVYRPTPTDPENGAFARGLRAYHQSSTLVCQWKFHAAPILA